MESILSVVVRWLGIALALLAVWPMARALDAVGAKDYLGGVLLLGITYVLARTGVELVAAVRPGTEAIPSRSPGKPSGEP